MGFPRPAGGRFRCLQQILGAWVGSAQAPKDDMRRSAGIESSLRFEDPDGLPDGIRKRLTVGRVDDRPRRPHLAVQGSRKGTVNPADLRRPPLAQSLPVAPLLFRVCRPLAHHVCPAVLHCVRSLRDAASRRSKRQFHRLP